MFAWSEDQILKWSNFTHTYNFPWIIYSEALPLSFVDKLGRWADTFYGNYFHATLKVVMLKLKTSGGSDIGCPRLPCDMRLRHVPMQKIKIQDPQGPASSIHFRILGSQGPMSSIHFRILGSQGPMTSIHFRIQGFQGPTSGIHFRILGSQDPMTRINFRIQSPQGPTT